MKKQPRFSLIISVYNSQRYLKACVDSCIQQTFENIEVICVDDCSTDTSLAMLNEYQHTDSRVHVIAHDKNKKQGGARNTGIAHATGEYCWIIDSDDILPLDACAYLDKKLSETNVDLLWFCFDIFQDTDETPVFIPSGRVIDFAPTNKVIQTRQLKETPFVEPWHYVVKRTIIENLFFRENVYHEDVDFTYKTFYSAQTLYFDTVTLYHYRIRKGSDTHSVYDATKLKNQIEACLSLYEFIKEKHIKPASFFCRFTQGYSEFLQNMVENQCKDFQLGNYLEILKEIEQKTRKPKTIFYYICRIIIKTKSNKISADTEYGSQRT